VSRCKKNYCADHVIDDNREDLYFLRNAGRYYDLWLKIWKESLWGEERLRVKAFTLCRDHSVARLLPWLEMTEEEITRRSRCAEITYDKYMRLRKTHRIDSADENPMMHKYK